MRFRSANQLSAEHIGRRVTVRRNLADGGTGDVIGVLEAIDDRTLRIRDRHGSIVHIARADVVATRVIPR